MQESVSLLHYQRKENVNQQADQGLLQAMASSEAEARRHAREALVYEEQLKQVMAQSLTEHRRMGGDNEGGARGVTQQIPRKAVSMANGSSGTQQPPSYDHGHLAGTRQSELQAQDSREKTAQEKTEEEIVMEYVKKQSLLEAHHQNKGKGRARATEEDDERQA